MQLDTLRTGCADFLRESSGIPLVKMLPKSTHGFCKIKVRKRRTDIFSTVFNEVYKETHKEILNRSILANGIWATDDRGGTREPFFVFPINGYKFMYSVDSTICTEETKQSLFFLLETMHIDDVADILDSNLPSLYTCDNLKEGLEMGSEMMVFGIPYFYAVRCSLVDSYSALYSSNL